MRLQRCNPGSGGCKDVAEQSHGVWTSSCLARHEQWSHSWEGQMLFSTLTSKSLLKLDSHVGTAQKIYIDQNVKTGLWTTQPPQSWCVIRTFSDATLKASSIKSPCFLFAKVLQGKRAKAITTMTWSRILNNLSPFVHLVGSSFHLGDGLSFPAYHLMPGSWYEGAVFFKLPANVSAVQREKGFANKTTLVGTILSSWPPKPTQRPPGIRAEFLGIVKHCSLPILPTVRPLHFFEDTFGFNSTKQVAKHDFERPHLRLGLTKISQPCPCFRPTIHALQDVGCLNPSVLNMSWKFILVTTNWHPCIAIGVCDDFLHTSGRGFRAGDLRASNNCCCHFSPKKGKAIFDLATHMGQI